MTESLLYSTYLLLPTYSPTYSTYIPTYLRPPLLPLPRPRIQLYLFPDPEFFNNEDGEWQYASYANADEEVGGKRPTSLSVGVWVYGVELWVPFFSCFLIRFVRLS